MTRTDLKVRTGPEGVHECFTPRGAAAAVESTLDVLQGRWKITIVFLLFAREVLRYSEFSRLIPELSQRVLTKQLKALEQDGVIVRTVYPTKPPKVEYRLSPRGLVLRPVLTALRDWGSRR